MPSLGGVRGGRQPVSLYSVIAGQIAFAGGRTPEIGGGSERSASCKSRTPDRPFRRHLWRPFRPGQVALCALDKSLFFQLLEHNFGVRGDLVGGDGRECVLQKFDRLRL